YESCFSLARSRCTFLSDAATRTQPSRLFLPQVFTSSRLVTFRFFYLPSPSDAAFRVTPRLDAARRKQVRVIGYRSAVGGVVAAVLALSRSHAIGSFTLQSRPTVGKRDRNFFRGRALGPPTAMPPAAQASSRP